VKPNVLIAGNYDAFVNVTYRDKSGEWTTKVIKKTITLHSAQQTDGNSYLFLILLVFIALVVWYFKFRKPPVKK
jgi:ABC-type uncharacterized transport system permease subunit